MILKSSRRTPKLDEPLPLPGPFVSLFSSANCETTLKIVSIATSVLPAPVGAVEFGKLMDLNEMLYVPQTSIFSLVV